MTDEPRTGSTGTRIVALLLLVVIVVCFPFALMMAGMSIMATDSGVTNEATAFILVMWLGVLAMLIAGVLALAALIVASRKLLMWTVVLTVLPVAAGLAMLFVAGA